MDLLATLHCTGGYELTEILEGTLTWNDQFYKLCNFIYGESHLNFSWLLEGQIMRAVSFLYLKLDVLNYSLFYAHSINTNHKRLVNVKNKIQFL